MQVLAFCVLVMRFDHISIDDERQCVQTAQCWPGMTRPQRLLAARQRQQHCLCPSIPAPCNLYNLCVWQVANATLDSSNYAVTIANQPTIARQPSEHQPRSSYSFTQWLIGVGCGARGHHRATTGQRLFVATLKCNANAGKRSQSHTRYTHTHAEMLTTASVIYFINQSTVSICWFGMSFCWPPDCQLCMHVFYAIASTL